MKAAINGHLKQVAVQAAILFNCFLCVIWVTKAIKLTNGVVNTSKVSFFYSFLRMSVCDALARSGKPSVCLTLCDSQYDFVSFLLKSKVHCRCTSKPLDTFFHHAETRVHEKHSLPRQLSISTGASACVTFKKKVFFDSFSLPLCLSLVLSLSLSLPLSFSLSLSLSLSRSSRSLPSSNRCSLFVLVSLRLFSLFSSS